MPILQGYLSPPKGKNLVDFTRNFTLRWLLALKTILDIHDKYKLTPAKDERYEKLENQGKRLLALYHKFNKNMLQQAVFPSREVFLESPLLQTDYILWVEEFNMPARVTAAEQGMLEKVKSECRQLIVDLRSAQKTIRYWDALRARSFRANIPEPDPRPLVWEDLDGDWELEAQLKFASTPEHVDLKTTERLCLYGFTKEQAKKMMVDAGYYRDEEDVDAFKVAISYITQCQYDPKFGFHACPEERVQAAIKMGLLPGICSSFSNEEIFDQHAGINLWQWVQDNVIAKDEIYSYARFDMLGDEGEEESAPIKRKPDGSNEQHTPVVRSTISAGRPRKYDSELQKSSNPQNDTETSVPQMNAQEKSASHTNVPQMNFQEKNASQTDVSDVQRGFLKTDVLPSDFLPTDFLQTDCLEADFLQNHVLQADTSEIDASHFNIQDYILENHDPDNCVAQDDVTRNLQQTNVPQENDPQADVQATYVPESYVSQDDFNIQDYVLDTYDPETDSLTNNVLPTDVTQLYDSQTNFLQTDGPATHVSRTQAPQDFVDQQDSVSQTDIPQAYAQQNNAQHNNAQQSHVLQPQHYVEQLNVSQNYNSQQPHVPQTNVLKAYAPQAHVHQANIYGPQTSIQQPNAPRTNCNIPQGYAQQPYVTPNPQPFVQQANVPQVYTQHPYVPQADVSQPYIQQANLPHGYAQQPYVPQAHVPWTYVQNAEVKQNYGPKLELDAPLANSAPIKALRANSPPTDALQNDSPPVYTPSTNTPETKSSQPNTPQIFTPETKSPQIDTPHTDGTSTPSSSSEEWFDKSYNSFFNIDEPEVHPWDFSL